MRTSWPAPSRATISLAETTAPLPLGVQMAGSPPPPLPLQAPWALVPAAIVLLYFVLFDISFAWIDPPTNAFVSRFAPASVVTMLMSINLMFTGGVPNLLVGWIGRFYEPLGPSQFWWLHAGIAAAGAALALSLRPLIKWLLAGHAEGTI